MSRVTRPPAAAAARHPTTAVRVRFGPATERTPFRRYVDPRPAVAVVDPVDPAAPLLAEAADLHVLVVPDGRPSAAAAGWLGSDDDGPAVAVAVPAGRLAWRPGRAVLSGPVDDADAVVAAVADFAFYEAEVRRLEAALPAFERAAAADVPLAYRIDDAHADQWPRLGRTMEELAALRLSVARLGSRLTLPPTSLPTAGRRAFRRLVARSEAADRLDAVSDRLEACEDLYEGAVDRITDHRWWRKGHRLEAIIVGLLAVEGVQLTIELVLHYLQARGR